MISDTLFDAGEEIKRYLTEPVFYRCYNDESRRKVTGLLRHMRYIQWHLDSGWEARTPEDAAAIAPLMGDKAIAFSQTGNSDDAWIAATAAAHWGRMALPCTIALSSGSDQG